MPTRIFIGNAAYEYSSWACHTSATKEYILSIQRMKPSKEQVHEERVGVADL
jgi:hypothetical protein